MMAPIHFRNARLAAAHHILGRIIGCAGWRVEVQVLCTFRGNLTRGSGLTLSVSILPENDQPLPLGSTLYVRERSMVRARYVEAFLDGDPPDVVMDQIKFLKFRWRAPTGDPSKESFLW
jgi:hypothetical protein